MEDSVADRREEYGRGCIDTARLFCALLQIRPYGEIVQRLRPRVHFMGKTNSVLAVNAASRDLPNVPPRACGHLDNRVPQEETNNVAALFPGSLKVTVKNPVTTPRATASARTILSPSSWKPESGGHQLRSAPDFVRSAVGRFPLLLRRACRGGGSHRRDQIGQSERKVVTVAVAATTDAWQRSWIGFGDGSGCERHVPHRLRRHWWTTALTACSFSKDVALQEPCSGAMTARL